MSYIHARHVPELPTRCGSKSVARGGQGEPHMPATCGLDWQQEHSKAYCCDLGLKTKRLCHRASAPLCVTAWLGGITFFSKMHKVKPSSQTRVSPLLPWSQLRCQWSSHESGRSLPSPGRQRSGTMCNYQGWLLRNTFPSVS